MSIRLGQVGACPFFAIAEKLATDCFQLGFSSNYLLELLASFLNSINAAGVD